MCPCERYAIKGQYIFEIRTSKNRDICDVRILIILLSDINDNIDTIAQESMLRQFWNIYGMLCKNTMAAFVKHLIQFNPQMCTQLGRIRIQLPQNSDLIDHNNSTYKIQNRDTIQ